MGMTLVPELIRAAAIAIIIAGVHEGLHAFYMSIGIDPISAIRLVSIALVIIVFIIEFVAIQLEKAIVK